MEIGQHHIDGAEAIARRDEDRGLACEGRDRAVLARPRFRAAAAKSSRPRRCGPPARRAALSASAVAALTTPYSACIRWSSVSSALTGRNVPAPTCSVTLCRRRRAPQPRHQVVGEMQARGRRRDRALVVREQGLVVAAVAPRRRRGATRYRAAAACRRARRSPGRAPGRGRRTRASPRRPRLCFHGRVELAEETDLALVAEANDVAGREPLAGFTKARQREPSSRLMQRGLDARLRLRARCAGR